ncbi:hypothetical protein AGMMS50268_34540 [Spirochaetia bacterium]|nr:hypothetical protein AGMMS50268_34540 [Spirochaetia bacterium]
MKTVYAFVFFINLCFTGIFPVLSYGQDNLNFTIGKTPYRISLAAGAGVILGQTEEIVYKSSDTDDYLSQLLWDLMPQVYIGTALSLARANPLAGLGAALDVSVKFGIPMASGTMEDRDWQDKADPDRLTDFSSHDAATGNVLLLDISGGVPSPLPMR